VKREDPTTQPNKTHTQRTEEEQKTPQEPQNSQTSDNIAKRSFTLAEAKRARLLWLLPAVIIIGSAISSGAYFLTGRVGVA
jgi:uncharacterized protein HemX